MRHPEKSLILLTLLFAACGSDAPPGAPEADVIEAEDVSLDAPEDTQRADVAPDVTETDTSETDTETDGSDLGAFGDTCTEDLECASEICLHFDASLEEGVCTDPCTDSCEDDAYACVFVTESGTDGRSICVPTDYCADGDGDGFGVGPGCSGPDCDDTNAAVNPAADEPCDGVDNDCDGNIDDNPIGAGDVCDSGFLGACAAGQMACTAGELVCTGDVAPSTELCDGIDNDCDGAIDEDDAGDPLMRPCYDGPAGTEDEGVCSAGVQTCDAGDFGGCVGQTLPAGELCDGLDNNCDGRTDEVDVDGDGFFGCPGPGSDCNDDDATVYPGAPETCNMVDDNCNGNIDEFALTTFYRDRDGDGFGDPATTEEGCVAPVGYVEESGDCADNNAEINPDAPELCNQRDDNCNFEADEGLETFEVYRDFDGDGFGGDGVPVLTCMTDSDGDGTPDTSLIVGYVPNADDCNDGSGLAYPGAEEICDGILNDCNVDTADWLCPSICSGTWPLPLGGTAGYPVITQLDGDPEFEIVTRVARHAIATNHDGSVLWDTPGDMQYSYPAMGDINGDAVMDLVSSGAGHVAVYNGRDGSVLVDMTVASSAYYYGAGIFDFDRDGVFDIVPTTSGAGHILYMNADTTLREDVALNMLGTAGERFFLETPTIADVDGDSDPEVLIGSGHWRCASGARDCEGRQYVFDRTGAYYNDPTWTDDTLPQFQVSPYPGAFAGEGRFAVVADLDGDGTSEYLHTFGGSSPTGYIWNFDGTEHALSGDSAYQASRPYLAAVTDDTWELNDAGVLRNFPGPVVDMDGDGTFETLHATSDGIFIEGVSGRLASSQIAFHGVPVIGDINRDGALDVVFIGNNSSLNCYTYGANTYDDNRVLVYGGGTDALSRGHYPTQALDPFEPNNPPTAFDPTTTSDPVADSRAFSTMAFTDRRTSGGGWYRQIRGMLSTMGDHDFYTYTGSRGGAELTMMARDYDLYLHIFNSTTKAYIETRSSTNTGTTQEHVSCQATDGCTGGPFLFIIEVAPKDPAVDYGPFPYTLRHW